MFFGAQGGGAGATAAVAARVAPTEARMEVSMGGGVIFALEVAEALLAADRAAVSTTGGSAGPGGEQAEGTQLN